jgi:hypothetical protein
LSHEAKNQHCVITPNLEILDVGFYVPPVRNAFGTNIGEMLMAAIDAKLQVASSKRQV